MTQLDLKFFPASYGDCFLVSVGTDTRDHILIDAGFPSTYSAFLKDHLKELSKNGECLDLFVISHIDADHISGGVVFLEENGHAKNPQIIAIKDIWHNSYRHLQFQKNSQLQLNESQLEILNSIIRKDWPKERIKKIDFEEKKGAKQGSSLARLILKNEHPWNRQFDNQAVSFNDKILSKKLNDRVTITLLSPSQDKLLALEKQWRKELRKMGFTQKLNEDQIFDDAFEFLVAHEKVKDKDYEKRVSYSKSSIQKLLNQDFTEDKSVTNGSSISFIIEVENKKVLFLGDSHPFLIEKSLQQYSNERPIFFNAIKVSHHGSRKNTNTKLLELIDSDKFIISTNGKKHNHPDIVTLLRIITKPTAHQKRIYFNYKTEASTYLDDPDLKKEYNYQVYIPKKEEVINIKI